MDNMNENNKDVMNVNNKESEKKNKLWIIAFFLAIPVFTCFGIFISSNFLGKDVDFTLGDFNVVDTPQDNENDETESRENGTITFAGYGKYRVSEKKPNIEIKNPAGNFVDMVFVLKDEASGEIIAKTDKVAAGKYVYVNVMNYYKKPGNYTIVLNTLTYDSKSGEQMNGMNQKMEVSI